MVIKLTDNTYIHHSPCWAPATVIIEDGDNDFFSLAAEATDHSRVMKFVSDIQGHRLLKFHHLYSVTTKETKDFIITMPYCFVCRDMDNDSFVTIYFKKEKR